jgi:hypothetical protein
MNPSWGLAGTHIRERRDAGNLHCSNRNGVLGGEGGEERLEEASNGGRPAMERPPGIRKTAF